MWLRYLSKIRVPDLVIKDRASSSAIKSVNNISKIVHKSPKMYKLVIMMFC